MTNKQAYAGLLERLEKRAKQDRDYAANNAVVAALLEPEYAKFEARTGHNLYAVRMQIDHRNSAKRDAAWADDLEQAAEAISSLLKALEAIAGMLSGYAGQPNHMGDVFKIADAALNSDAPLSNPDQGGR